MPWERQSYEHLIGQRFGNLEVLQEVPTPKNSSRKLLCRCDCGTVKPFRVQVLRLGSAKSCGCGFRRERQSASMSRHGFTHTDTYRCWVSMKTRCRNPKANNYERYGGRGIKVCDRWLTFAHFLTDMGPRPGKDYSIERKDPDGDYEPGNCIWATQQQQGANRRNNVRLTYDGRTQTAAQWAAELGIKPHTLRLRIHQGWTAEAALTTPVRGSHVSSNAI